MQSVTPATHHYQHSGIKKKKKNIRDGLKTALKGLSQEGNSNERSIEKKVYYISEERFNLQNNSHLPDPEPYKSVETKAAAILIRPQVYSSDYFDILASKFQYPNELLEAVGQERMLPLIEHFWRLACHPVALLKHLRPIEEAITEKLQITFDPAIDAPEYLIAGKWHYVPGPPPEGHSPKKKGRLLDKVLREKEQALEINMQGTPVFTGGVDMNIANHLVGSGMLFKEDVSISTLLLHGKNSHRLLLQALFESLKKTVFEDLKPTLILKLLVFVKYNDNNLWGVLLDCIDDSKKVEADLPYTSSYNYSCQSPFTFNSLLLCFGKEMGLPNLMYSMLDSHWKAADKMARSVIALNGSITPSRSAAYLIAMESLSLNASGVNNIGASFPFTNSPVQASRNSKYEIFPGYEYTPYASRIKIKP